MALNFQVSEATAAQRRFPLYLVDATDGITPETGEAAGQPQISKNGAAFANTSATLTAIGNGSYYVELTAGELDTLGMVTIRFKSANTAEFSLTGQVVSFDPYDATPPVDVTTWNGTAVVAPNTAGVPVIDLIRIVGGLVPTPTTAGVPDVNVERWLDTLVTLSATSTKPEVDINSISDDATAANNMEADYDGTGFNKSNSEIGTVAVNTDMRGTENAALASVLGTLADAAADGDPTAADTAMQYIKQLINILIGTTGIVSFPASAAPANGVSIAEVLREVFDDVTGLNGDAMRGTNSAALASVATEPRLAELDAGNLPTDIANVQSDTDDIQTRLPAALVGGAMDGDVSNIQTNVIDADALNVDAVQEITRAINPQVNIAFDDITFLMVDSTNHNPNTGLTVSGERSLNGGAFAAVTGSIAEISDGIYQLDASAADMNGAMIIFRFFEGTSDDTFYIIKTAA